MILVAVFARLIANHDPFDTSVQAIWIAPGSEYYLGGDNLGRDVFSRLVYGARISLVVGIVASFVGCTIGMGVGVASVHFGGKTDLIVQRFIDALIAFPTLILAIAIMAALIPMPIRPDGTAVWSDISPRRSVPFSRTSKVSASPTCSTTAISRIA